MKRPWVRLLPVLALHALVILAFARGPLAGDEKRYVGLARNLLSGFYIEPGTLKLWSGPGYPLVLVPFLWAGVPALWARLLNALFMYFAALLAYGGMKPLMSQRAALAAAFTLGCYPAFLPETVALLTEPLSVMLVSGFLFCTVRAMRAPSARWLAAGGAFLGWLALTKAIYGWVILGGVGVSAVLAVRSAPARKMLVMGAAALALNAPYLAYTQAAVGKPLYWSNAGGLSLYWMTTPHADEYGDWTSPGEVLEGEGFEEHRETFRRLDRMDYVRRDAELRRLALRNLRESPGKCALNWAMNVCRMFFCYPNSHKLQRPHTLGYIVVNGFLLAALAACAYPMWRARRRLPPEIVAILAFAALAFGVNSLFSAVPRMLNPIVPALAFLIAYTAANLADVRLRPGPAGGPESPWKSTS
jgi:4-amino-4-deoxy-L-arabinose transferase-like glycosyltransferase